ncbi:MAG: hypothetical protein AAF907_11030, partial [Planctomycetota bacterium]
LGVVIGLGLVVASGEGVARGLFDPVVIGTTLGVFGAGLAVGTVVKREGQAGRGVAVRTLLAFGFLLVTVVGLQVVAGGNGLVESWHGGGVAEVAE